MRVLITGIAGFIGSHLADRLVRLGHEVVGIDDLSTGSMRNIEDSADGIQVVVGDIRDNLSTRFRLGPSFDVIYHAAASYKDRNDWERDASVNVLGTINVVREVQRSGARLVYFQTSLCYGPGPFAGPIRIDQPLDPRGSYAVSKTAGERYIMDSGVEYVSLRLANIYGPRNLSGPVPAFYKRLAAGEPCTVVDARRDFVYVDDLVNLAVQVGLRAGYPVGWGKAKWHSGIVHVSSGADLPIWAIYSAVRSAMGLGMATYTDLTPRGADDVATLLLDASETYRDFGWAAETPLGGGIAKAVEWYSSHGVEQTFTHLAVKG